MKINKTALLLAAGLIWATGATVLAEVPARPNIILIYADDLGYGDTSAYGATAVKTPNIDHLADTGLRFTSAYATASTCTPSRYSLMTGRYAFRQPDAHILPGDARLIVPLDHATLPSMLKKAGYVTGIVGKWHLGLGATNAPIDWNSEVKPGPRETGFDYSFIMAATADRVPCVYLENGKIVGLDTNDPLEVSYDHPFPGEPTAVAEYDYLTMKPSHGHADAVVNRIGRIGFMTGGKSALWKDEDRADLFNEKALQFIEQNRDHPFFLYFATHDIHVPRVPAPRFVGQTTMGPRGDVIVELDWNVGEVLATLDRLHLTTNTLVIFSSDNGPVIDDGYQDGAIEKLGSHKPAGPFRGGKYSVFEGGTREPMIVRWPGQVKPGVSDALVCQVDLLASLAELTGQTLVPGDAPDSLDVLPALLGQTEMGRAELIEQGDTLALRQGKWKYIAPSKLKSYDPYTHTELGNAKSPQLYDLFQDPGETNNVAATQADITAHLAARLAQLRREDHSISR